MKLLVVLTVGLGAASMSCVGLFQKGSGPATSTPADSGELAASGIVPGWLDRNVNPCDDFYAYSCGGFERTAVIPADRASWSAIEVLIKENEDFLREVLEKAARDPGADPVAVK